MYPAGRPGGYLTPPVSTPDPSSASYSIDSTSGQSNYGYTSSALPISNGGIPIGGYPPIGRLTFASPMSSSFFPYSNGGFGGGFGGGYGPPGYGLGLGAPGFGGGFNPGFLSSSGYPPQSTAYMIGQGFGQGYSNGNPYEYGSMANPSYRLSTAIAFRGIPAYGFGYGIIGGPQNQLTGYQSSSLGSSSGLSPYGTRTQNNNNYQGAGVSSSSVQSNERDYQGSASNLVAKKS